MSSRVRRVGRGLVALFVVAAVTLAALEVVCRIGDPIGISYYAETARWLDSMVVRDGVGYWNRPGQTGKYYGADVRINSLGLRGPEIAAKGPGEFRILLAGDSFPFGIGVAEDDALPAALEALLDADAGPGADVRVVNMGVVSYNTEQALRQLEELGLSLQPDLVVLAFAVNDIEPVMWVFDKRRGAIVDLAQRSYAVALLSFVARSVRYRLFGFSGIALGEFREDSPRWRAVDRSLSRMNARCREAGAGFIVFSYDKLPAPKALLEGVASREGFPYVTVLPEGSPRWRDRDPRELVNSPVDAHPNIEGNRMWAELLAQALRERNLVPSR